MTAYWNKTAFNTGMGAVIGAGVGLLAPAVYVLSNDLRHAPPILVLALILMFAQYTVGAGGMAGGIVGFLLPVKSDQPFFLRQIPLKLSVVVCLASALYAGVISPALTRREKTQNLQKAVYGSNRQGVHNAIEHGASVDRPIGAGTPLYLAAQKGDVETCRYLLSRGADINHRNLSDETALWIALASRHYDVATFLANSGADVNLTDDKGESPLMLAVRGDNTEIIETLISKGADVNHMVNGGSYSPLITTSMYDRLDNAKLLLDAGANPNLANLHEMTSLNYATTKGDQQMIDLLVAHGAR